MVTTQNEETMGSVPDNSDNLPAACNCSVDDSEQGTKPCQSKISSRNSDDTSAMNPGPQENATAPMGGYGTTTREKLEENMRRKLKFFFMNPIEKWQAKRRFPYKLIVQVIKIALVTVQLCLFATNRYNHVNYAWDNRIAFSHLFLRGWESTREVEAYPPATGALALYEIGEFYETIDYALNGRPWSSTPSSDETHCILWIKLYYTTNSTSLLFLGWILVGIFLFHFYLILIHVHILHILLGFLPCWPGFSWNFWFPFLLNFQIRPNQWMYVHLENAIGPYFYTGEDNVMAMPMLCLHEYKEGTIYGFNESYIFNSEIVTTCHSIPVSKETNFSSISFLGKISFSALVKAMLTFSLKTVNFKAAGPLTAPDCYRFDVEISFDNRDHDGQMLVALEADAIRLFCKGDVQYLSDYKLDSILRSLLNYLVIIICIVSLALCSRAIYRAQQLKWETVQFFKRTFGKNLSMKGHFEFLNMWYIMIITNDIMIIIGSAMKERIEKKQFVGDQWNACSVLLGTGNLLVWFGLLRYLGFFKTYNVLILTLKKAAPKVARFLLCTLLLYSGYTFCGWLVLGPYHLKFRSLSSTSECLFSLINGDDMFATFFVMSKKSPMLWWYSRLYLYSFISLFIYVVLSLFISVIMDAYETIKMCYRDGFPKSDLQEFIYTGVEEDPSTMFHGDSSTSLLGVIRHTCCGRRDAVEETEPLIT